MLGPNLEADPSAPKVLFSTAMIATILNCVIKLEIPNIEILPVNFKLYLHFLNPKSIDLNFLI